MRTKRTTFSAFAAEVIEACRKAGRLGTARNYERTLSSFEMFIRCSADGLSDDILFSDITSGMLVEYEHWLFSRGVTRNSSSFYMRNLRSMFNKAIEVRETRFSNLFGDVYTGIDRTKPRAVDEGLLVRMQGLDLCHSEALALTRDLFVFSFCTRGMPFVDMAFLKKTDIHRGVISYVRRKTGQRLNVRLEPCMERIIRRYVSETSGTPYIFPIITSSDPSEAYEQYRIALNYHNRKLKRLAEMLGESQNLSTYTARHTWATAARNHNVPVSVISAGMGHTSEKTTRIYLAELDDSVVDLENRRVIQELG